MFVGWRKRLAFLRDVFGPQRVGLLDLRLGLFAVAALGNLAIGPDAA